MPGGSQFIAARSPMFKWRAAEKPTPDGAALQAHKRLVKRLLADGWTADGDRGEAWYEHAFRRPYAGDGEPGAEDREP